MEKQGNDMSAGEIGIKDPVLYWLFRLALYSNILEVEGRKGYLPMLILCNIADNWDCKLLAEELNLMLWLLLLT